MQQAEAVYHEWVARRRAGRLWVEDDPAPLGLDVRAPRFSWVVPLPGRGRRQTAYRLLVASTPELLRAGGADLWDSGVVESDVSIQVLYAGAPLASNRTYCWKVRVRDEAGRWGRWSPVGAFGTALLDATDWQAQWIGRGNPDEVVPDVAAYVLHDLTPEVQAVEPDPRAPLFRKAFTLEKPVARARVYVTGLGLYELRLNGRKVGDAVLTPCRTEFRTRVLYDTYDVTDLLQRGENALGLMLGSGWFNGQKRYWGWQYQWYGSPRALLQLEIDFADGTRTRVVTDGSWRAAWGPITFNCIYDGEDYDARQELPGWDAPGFDDAAWAPANVVPSPGGRLAANPAPPNRVAQTFAPVRMWESAPGVFIFDMGLNFTGWVRLRVRGPRGVTVQLRYSEEVTPDGALNTTTIMRARAALRYTLCGDGDETYEPRFTYGGFQYVEVTGFPGTPGLDALTGRFAHAAVAPAGEFSCASDPINHVHRCMVQSQRCNIQMGVPTDDTQRDERLGWGADGWASAPQAMHNFTMARLYRKWIGDFQDCQLPSGVTDMIVPRAGLEEDLVWSAAYLFIPWWLYVRIGDRRILEDFYPSWEAYLAYLATQGREVFLQRPLGADPLHYTDEWDTLPAGHLQRSQWGDHLSTAEGWAGRSGLPNSISTAFYARLAWLMAEISAALGREERAQHYRALAREIRDAYNDAFFDGARYDHGEQSSQAWALDFGLAPAGREAAIFAALCEDIARHGGHPTSGYPGTPSLVEVLSEWGRPDLVWQMAQLTDCPSWQFMVRGRTTIPEAWDGTGSLNHHALASPLDLWLYNTLAGIRPDPAAPGFALIIIAPYIPPDLAWARASLDTLRGEVASSWRQTRDAVYLTVMIPANTRATVRLPHPRPEEVRENGVPVAGILQDGATVVEIGSGRYRFSWVK